MNSAQNIKRLQVIAPQLAVGAATPTSTSVDTAGYDYATFHLILGTVDIAAATLAIQEGDASTSFANITGLIVGTSAVFNSTVASVLPASSDSGTITSFRVDLRAGRKRHLKMNLVVAGASSDSFNCCGMCELTRAETVPTTASDMGYLQLLSA